jgi:hypothetical protein
MPQREHQSVQDVSSPDSDSVTTSFDELAKGLATGTLSRGKALRWMGGALVGAALASVPGVAWANDCRRLGRECRRDSQCCSRNCIRRGDDKVCGCPERQTRCNDRCVNLNRNERHCGSCFNRCLEGQECVGGECQCPSGQTCCNGACVSNVCGPGETFESGTCQCQPCSVSGGVLCNGQCVSTLCGFDRWFNYTTCQCESTCVQCGASSLDCSPGNFPQCGNGGSCSCLRKIEGGCSCVAKPAAPCVELGFCTTTADCPAGKTCVVGTGCNDTACEGVCVDACPNPGC